MMRVTATALMTFLNPSERAAQHHRSGVKYGGLRRALRQFIQIDVNLMETAALRLRLAEFTDAVATLQAEAPPIPSSAHRAALDSIQSGSADYTAKELAQAGG